MAAVIRKFSPISARHFCIRCHLLSSFAGTNVENTVKPNSLSNSTREIEGPLKVFNDLVETGKLKLDLFQQRVISEHFQRLYKDLQNYKPPAGGSLLKNVAEMVRYLLFVDRKKYPIKRGDITKNVMREHAKAFNEVFELAKAQLQRIFGIEIEEIEVGKSKAFILVDAIEEKQKYKLIDWGEDLPKMGLLMVVLSLIFMSNGVITESFLWHTLKKLGLEPKQEHKDFEDPEKLLSQEFTRQGYLDRRKLVGSEGLTFQYRWGPRAAKELTKRQVLEFVAEMYGNSVEDWSTQMREVLEEENGNNGNE